MTVVSMFKVLEKVPVRDVLKYLPGFGKNPIILEHFSIDLFFSCSDILEREYVGTLPFHSGRQPLVQNR